MNYEWVSIKEHGLPEDEGYYWVTIKEVNSWFRSVIKLYFNPIPHYISDEIKIYWFYDEDEFGDCSDEIIAYMDEVIPEPYQGE